MKVTSDVGLDVCNVKLNKMVKKLWNLETMGIPENEVLVYEKYVNKVKFKNERYEVCLPFKENRQFLQDNFAGVNEDYVN